MLQNRKETSPVATPIILEDIDDQARLFLHLQEMLRIIIPIAYNFFSFFAG